MATREEAIEVLKTIYDPEIYIDLWTLGLIYDIEIVETEIHIRMTFTSIACPVGPALAEEVRSKMATLPGITKATVDVVFNPPWEPSEELRAMRGIY